MPAVPLVLRYKHGVFAPISQIVFGSAFGGGSKKMKEEEEEEEEETSKPVVEGPRTSFQMPLHYPQYKKEDYEKMESWKVDALLKAYGIHYQGTLDEKRAFAMGAFLWPDQY